jgi:hypothetical protein
LGPFRSQNKHGRRRQAEEYPGRENHIGEQLLIGTIDGVSLHKRIISVTEALPRKTVTPAAKPAAAKPQKSRRPPKRRK